MLIILPPSETKRPAPESGEALNLNSLSFPALNPMRQRVMAALIETSASGDAFERLRVRPTLADLVVGNLDLRQSPTRPAADVYSGPLHAAFGWSALSRDARQRADARVVISSALWGLVRPSDQIATYRLHVCSNLIGMDDLEPSWRTVVPQVLAGAATDQGAILDLRSPTYQAIGMPAGLGERTAIVRVLPEAGAPSIGDVEAKRIRGEVARFVVESDVKATDLGELAGALDARWPTRLDPPRTRHGPWTILLRPSD